jgi:hypothetical protein
MFVLRRAYGPTKDRHQRHLFPKSCSQLYSQHRHLSYIEGYDDIHDSATVGASVAAGIAPYEFWSRDDLSSDHAPDRDDGQGGDTTDQMTGAGIQSFGRWRLSQMSEGGKCGSSFNSSNTDTLERRDATECLLFGDIDGLGRETPGFSLVFRRDSQ